MINPPSFGIVTKDSGVQAEPFSVSAAPAGAISITVSSSEPALRFSTGSSCQSSAASLQSATPANLTACLDTSRVTHGNYVAIITVRPVSNQTYTSARSAIAITVFPVGEIKTVPSAITLSPDVLAQTVAVSFQDNNSLSSSSASIRSMTQDPAFPDEGDWLLADSNCLGLTLTRTASCVLSLKLVPERLNNRAVVGQTYSDRLVLESAKGDRADVIVNFNFSRAITAPLTVTTTGTFSGPALSPLSFTLTAAGGTPPYQWSAAGLPAGLTLDRDSGIISGTVQQGGTSSLAVMVTDSKGVQSQLATITLQITLPPNPTSITRLFPHIADGGEWQTDILLINDNTAPVTAELRFRLDGASTINVVGRGAVSTISGISIPANGSVSFRTAGAAASPTIGGWIEVNASLPLKGQALFRRHASSDGRYYEGAVPLVAPVTSFTFPFDGGTFTEGSRILTGLGIANTGASSAQLTCTGFSAAGVLLFSGLQLASPIPALGHTAFNLQITPPFQDRIGTGTGLLSCTATQPIGVLGLRSFGTAAVSSLPIF